MSRRLRLGRRGWPLLLVLLGWVAALPGRAGTTNRLVWPAAPEPARVAYLRGLSRPADFGARRPLGRRVVSFLVGDDHADAGVRPGGVAADAAGNLLVTDAEAGVVCAFEAATHRFQRWDRLGGLRLVSPVAAAREGDACFLADSGLRAVVGFSPEGRLRFAVTNGFERPAGLALSGDRLYVADAAAHRIVVCDREGRARSGFGRRGSDPGEFNFPTHLAAMPDGRLLVTDALNARVQILAADGTPLRVLGSRGDGSGHFNRPKGVAADRLGHIYVADALFDNVQVFDAEGRLLLFFGASGQGAGEFWMPGGVAVGPDNRVYVADTHNRRLQVFQYVGEP